MLCASILKSFFEFQTWIPNDRYYYKQRHESILSLNIHQIIKIKILGVNHATNNIPCGSASYPYTIYASIFLEGDPRMIHWLIHNGGNDVKACLRN